MTRTTAGSNGRDGSTTEQGPSGGDGPTASGDPAGGAATRRHPRWVPVGALAIVALSVVPATALAAAEPVVLQSELCNTNIPTYLTGFLQITTVLGLVGAIAVWQADTLAEVLTMNPAQKRNLRSHKRSAAKAAVTLLLIGPVSWALVQAMGLPMASCFDLFNVF